MKLGFVSDSLGGMPFDAMLDHAARLGCSGVEVNTGGWSTASHFDLAAMKSSAQARKSFLDAFASRGLEIISLNANGNPLHPTQPEQGKCLKDTIRLAGEMGIKTVCTMSGLPAGQDGDLMPNWVVSSSPPKRKPSCATSGRKNCCRSGRKLQPSPKTAALNGSRWNCAAINASTTCNPC